MGQSGTLCQTMRVQHIFVPPTWDAKTQSVESYIYGTFTQALTALALEEVQQILMVFAGRLWQFSIDEGKAVAYESGEAYSVVGSGDEAALGVLRALSPETSGNELSIIKKAFEAVCHYRSNVAGPFPYLCWSPDGTITSGVL